MPNRLRRGAHRFWDGEAGGGMVELAIAGGVFSVMLLGIFEFGIAAWSKNSVAADAREGARYAIVHGTRSGTPTDQAGVAAYVKARSSLGNSIRVYATWPGVGGSKDTDSLVIVSVAYSVPRRGPFIRAHVDSATSRMHIVY